MQMTYDDLYSKVEGLWHDSFKSPEMTALWNVVKLHKPFDFKLGGELMTACECGQEYPCKTIETIEKELI
jgi:hypothetical protein